jgi:hypothetical protein
MDSLHEPYRVSSFVNRVFVPSPIASSGGVVNSAEGLTYGRKGVPAESGWVELAQESKASPSGKGLVRRK